MTHSATRSGKAGPPEPKATQRGRRDPGGGSRPPRAGGKRWWALPAVVLVVAVVMGGLIVTSDLVLGGAAASGASGQAARDSLHPFARPLPSATARPPSEPVPVGAYSTRVYADQAGHRMTYYLFGPKIYSPDGKYPLVLLLHGGGERADPSLAPEQNRDVLLRQDYVKAFTEATTQERWPCFVVVPQATISERWVNVPAALSSYTLEPQPSLALALAMDIVDHLRQTYATIDANRIYVGGISMGGFGTWESLERWPTVFAAGFPLAGAGDPQAAAALVGVPIWAFHGSGDALVPVQGSRLMVQAVRAAGGTICYTEYPGAAHDIWFTIRPLEQTPVLTWLFSQRRSPSGPTSPVDCTGRVPREH